VEFFLHSVFDLGGLWEGWGVGQWFGVLPYLGFFELRGGLGGGRLGGELSVVGGLSMFL